MKTLALESGLWREQWLCGQHSVVAYGGRLVRVTAQLELIGSLWSGMFRHRINTDC